MENREKLLEDIMKDRKILEDIQVELNSLDKNLPFTKLFFIPLGISLGVLLVSQLLPFAKDQAMAIFIITFVASLSFITIRARAKMRDNKESLITRRKEVQHRLVEKSRRLKELSEEDLWKPSSIQRQKRESIYGPMS